MNRDQAIKIAGRAVISAMLIIAAASTGACGGIDDKLAGARKPYLKPHIWWSGKHRGRRIILDRNRNIRQTALIKRNCEARDVTAGSCVESIEYQYRQASGKPFPREENRMEWSIAYDDNTRMTVEIKDQGGKARGTVMGTVMLLSGERSIPLEKDRSASVRIRYDRLPGPGEAVLETRTFSMLGIRIGTVETYWTRVASP